MAGEQPGQVSTTNETVTQSSPPSVTLAQQGNAAEIASTAIATGPSTDAPTDEKTDISESVETSPVQQLWKLVQEHSHKEIWGVHLADPQQHVPSQVVLQKYLNANDGDVAKAKDQLKATLDYRGSNNVFELVAKRYSKEKFAGLGFITSYDRETTTPASRAVFTWNIYGNVKDIKRTFGDMDAFIEWRVALMELAMQALDLSNATEPITAEDDPYKIYQVHDYKGTSFLRSPPEVRSAAKKTVEVLAMAYPETLKEKFFVNVPAIMGFMYGVMKLFVAPKTIKKFHPMSNGGLLRLEFSGSKIPELGGRLPKEYGGNGDSLAAVGRELQLE